MGALRRAIGNILLIIGLLAATVAIIAHLSTLSLLNPSKLANQSQSLMSNSSIQSALADSLSNAIQPVAAAQGIVVSHAQLVSIMRSELTQPAIRNQFSADLQSADNHLIGTSTGPITIGGPQFSQILVAQLYHFSPALSSSLANRNFVITIPGADLPNLGFIARNIHTIERLATSIALLFLLLALVIHSDRAHVLRRIGAWLIAIAAFGIIMFWFVPAMVLPLIHLSWAQIASAVLLTTGSSTIAFYVELVVGGAVLLIVAKVASSLA
ncbi:MAG: hypothetical protein ACYDHP_09930 [Ferrimicrobium sp.]